MNRSMIHRLAIRSVAVLAGVTALLAYQRHTRIGQAGHALHQRLGSHRLAPATVRWLAAAFVAAAVAAIGSPST